MSNPAQRPPERPSLLELASAAVTEVLLFALSLLLGLGAGLGLVSVGVIPEQSMLLGSAMLGTAGLAYLLLEQLLRESIPVAALVEPPQRKRLGTCLLIWLGAVVVAIAGSSLLTILQEQVFGLEVSEQDAIVQLVKQGSRAELVMLAISAVVLAPLTEELLFRHMLFRRLLQRAGPTLAWILPAVAFSLFHFNPSGLLIYIWLGVVFALAYLFSGRFAVAVAVHAGHNAFALALLLWAPELV